MHAIQRKQSSLPSISAGLFVGAMPGLTATMALAVLLPSAFTRLLHFPLPQGILI